MTSPAEFCRFPECKCPMDPGPEPWCAIGLPQSNAMTPVSSQSPSLEEATPLQDRAAFLHRDSGMSWEEADAVALREVGIDDDAIGEMVSESGVMVAGSTGVAIMNYDEVCAFARHCLVHAPVAASAAKEAEVKRLRDLLKRARNQLDEDCFTEESKASCLAAIYEALKE